MSKKIGVISFPGTQCDRDVIKACKLVGHQPELLWYTDHFSIKDYRAFILPGGFSYGDYLRAGALAARSPAMQDIRVAAEAGQPVLGICNGFQILCEANLLEGTLQLNKNLSFIDEWTQIELCSRCTPWGGLDTPQKLRIPIAHKEGRFYASDEQMKKLKDLALIWWKYSKNPNGSKEDVAGIINEKGNVAGLMPHPERAMADWMGSTDGLPFFSQL